MQWGKHNNFNLEKSRIRFLKKIEVDSVTNCWNWKACLGSHKRYGSVGLLGKVWLAHRASWLIFNGADPAEMCVLHKCDNGLCVNPDHLFLGAQTDNIHDMENKKRSKHLAGAEHGRAKLDWDKVNLIREKHKNGASIRGLAREYNVTKGSISNIVKNKGWLTK